MHLETQFGSVRQAAAAPDATTADGDVAGDSVGESLAARVKPELPDPQAATWGRAVSANLSSLDSLVEVRVCVCVCVGLCAPLWAPGVL